MAFVNLSLIFGTCLLAIPIVLHLVMRQQPKQLVFPALRFIKQRRESNRHKLQLKQWLLLLLRCLAIVLLAVALARPSVSSMALGNWAIIGVLLTGLVLTTLAGVLCFVQRRGRMLVAGFLSAALLLLLATVITATLTLSRSEGSGIGNTRAPVGAVLALDTSPRMLYVRENRTRLEQAQEMASWLIGQLPEDSEVSIVDSRPGPRAFAIDLAAAETAIQRLDPCYTPVGIMEQLSDAIELARASRKPRKEVYLFTDLSHGAWAGATPDKLQTIFQRAPDVLLYVIDVGAEKPRNVGLGVPQLAADVLPRGSELEMRLAVSCLGPGGTHTLELFVEDQDLQLPVMRDGRVQLPKSRLRAKQIVELSDDDSQVVQFRLGALSLGVGHGTVRLAAQDALSVDDVRYFTFDVQDASPVLVLAPPGVITRFFTETIAPYEFRETGRARYDCRVHEQAELAGLELEDYAVICLLDPGPLTPPDWIRLKSFVEAGGGLAIFLGHNADPASFNDPAALPVLGSKLIRVWRSPGDLHVRLGDLSHPVTAAFRDIATSVPWNRFPVYRHWVLERLQPSARPLVEYTNNKPAILETSQGRGRCLIVTTPVSDPLQLRGRQVWNELPTGEDAWPCFVLLNEMMNYLVSTPGARLNFGVGETAVIPNSSSRYPERYQLFTPLEQPQDVLARDDRLQVKFTEYPGTYRLKGFRGGPVRRGFSVNLSSGATELHHLERSQLDDLLGPDRYHFARSTDDIILGVGEARLGREFYPALLSLVALVLAMEHLLANRAHRPTD